MSIRLAVICFLFIATLISAKTDKYRLAWVNDPSTTVVIGWNQISGQNPKVLYSTTDHGIKKSAYKSTATAEESHNYKSMTNMLVRLSGLKPGTAYYFIVADDNSVSRRLWFKTMSKAPKSFTFIAGGDSRSNRIPRQAGNLLVAKLRPSFVLFGGDYTSLGRSSQWKDWLDDWQLTISEDGRIYPIIPVLGNHENSHREALQKFFGIDYPNHYFAIPVNGTLMRIYALNSELTKSESKWDAQTTWLKDDLKANEKTTWKVAVYHRPMRPHSRSKRENDALVKAWAGLFHTYALNLAVESDSHLVKRTYPIRPSNEVGSVEGFVRDDKAGTVYIGEGCWGAPLRSPNDDKSWTMASGSFNQFKWIKVTPKEMLIRCVTFDNAEKVKALTSDDSFELPKGLTIWKPETGEILRLPFDPKHDTHQMKAAWKTIIPKGSKWAYHYAGNAADPAYAKPTFDDSQWHRGAAPLGYGEGGEKTLLKFGKDKKNKPITAYFRHTFNLPKGMKIIGAELTIAFDDGCLIRLNGKTVKVMNLPKGTITATTLADNRKGLQETKYHSVTVSPQLVTSGKNVLTVEVHQAAANSSDLWFDCEMKMIVK